MLFGTVLHRRVYAKQQTPIAKRTAGITLLAPVTGRLVPLETLDDPVFSQRLIGDGAAIRPEDGMVRSPCDGTIATVFPTGHALSITAANDCTIAIHIGLDTVELNGQGFRPLVSKGDRVASGQPLVEFDLVGISKTRDPVTILAIEQSNQFILHALATERVHAGDALISLERR